MVMLNLEEGLERVSECVFIYQGITSALLVYGAAFNMRRPSYFTQDNVHFISPASLPGLQKFTMAVVQEVREKLQIPNIDLPRPQ